MWFRNKKDQKIDMSNLPKHIAFIADGNGRWANKRGLARTLGHKAGKDAIKKVSELTKINKNIIYKAYHVI